MLGNKNFVIKLSVNYSFLHIVRGSRK